jgi:hypothetical protein
MRIITTKKTLEISGEEEYQKMVKAEHLRSKQITVKEGLKTEYQICSINTNRRTEYCTRIGQKAKKFEILRRREVKNIHQDIDYDG